MKLCLLFWVFWVGLDRLELDVVEEAEVRIIIGRIWIKIFKETLSQGKPVEEVNFNQAVIKAVMDVVFEELIEVQKILKAQGIFKN